MTTETRREPVTQAIAGAIARFALTDLPALVLHEARRSLFNVLAVAIGAGRNPGVDAILRAWHDDYVSLRRYLIDEGLLSRDGGVYWRSGGPVEI